MSTYTWIGDVKIDRDRLPDVRVGEEVTLTLTGTVERIDVEQVEVTSFGDEKPQFMDGPTTVTLSIRTLEPRAQDYVCQFCGEEAKEVNTSFSDGTSATFAMCPNGHAWGIR